MSASKMKRLVIRVRQNLYDYSTVSVPPVRNLIGSLKIYYTNFFTLHVFHPYSYPVLHVNELCVEADF
jgi:hypothetical protein